MLFLVRHAKAGERVRDHLAELARPLTAKGIAQAEAIVKPLVAAGATPHLFSSPYVRCMQTLEPLATAFGTLVVADPRLEEGRGFGPVLELLTDTPDGTVLCSHGDLIPDVIGALQRRGCDMAKRPHWSKGSVWVLHRDGGEIVKARSWPAPE